MKDNGFEYIEIHLPRYGCLGEVEIVIAPMEHILLVSAITPKQVAAMRDFPSALWEAEYQNITGSERHGALFREFVYDVIDKYGLIGGDKEGQQILISGAEIALLEAEKEISKKYHTDRLHYETLAALCTPSPLGPEAQTPVIQ